MAMNTNFLTGKLGRDAVNRFAEMVRDFQCDHWASAKLPLSQKAEVCAGLLDSMADCYYRVVF
eukprot:1441458-Pyramimonas_sp.AAC.1